MRSRSASENSIPIENSSAYEKSLDEAIAGMQDVCPGVAYRADENGYLVTIPAEMHHGHEARFAEVLNQFLGYVDAGQWPQEISQELVAKYRLLANAYELSHL